jgi:trk system potassium uptake protein TrkA
MQARILTRIGADAVVSPEDESADRWSHRLLSPFMIDHVELGEGYALVQMAVPGEWREKTLAELSLRANFNVTVVAIKRRVETASPTGVDTTERRVVDLPAPSSRLGADDTIILAGFDHDLERLPGA